MKLIPLTQDLFAQVDDHWFDYLMQWKWFAYNSRGIWYARRTPIKSDNTNKKVFHMHRVIMNTPDGLVVDHINHNGLNNLEENMRNCTNQQNSMNQKKKSNSSSLYTGVSVFYSDNKYKTIIAQITIQGVPTYLGCFSTEELAARAYDVKAKQYFGEFANLNFK